MLVGGSSSRRRHGRGRPVPDGFFETAVRLRSSGFQGLSEFRRLEA